LFKDKNDKIIYIGKAGSLKRRVGSYFGRARDFKTEALISEIFDLEIRETPSALEALILEAELIKKYKPKYNIRDKDDKSFIYIGITKDDFPKPVLVRKNELLVSRSKFQEKFGPFTSAGALREALKILRGIFPWSECSPPPAGGDGRPCFYYGIKKCPGVCVGKADKEDYKKNISGLKMFFRGKKKELLKNLERGMKKEAKKENFERAAGLRNKIYALNHIRDISLIRKDDALCHCFSEGQRYNATGRIEGYDVSNIGGQMAVGSMVVFEASAPKKSEYRKFCIKSAKAGDVPMLREILERRLKNNWPKPDIIFIDGGEGQVNAAEEILKRVKLKIPVIGIAKGLKRRNDRFVFDYEDQELKRVVKTFEDLFKQVRDEAHRFAIKYHRSLRKIA
jgi:excinuclease ABC subunit C